jgi:hypothetical protein
MRFVDVVVSTAVVEAVVNKFKVSLFFTQLALLRLIGG